jgi:hypothetical protein
MAMGSRETAANVLNVSETTGGTIGTRPVALVPSTLPFGLEPEGTDHGPSAGSGGNGFSSGIIASDAEAAFSPFNLAASIGGEAGAHQSNFALFDQQPTEIAGSGGSGGNGNLALGGDGGSAGSGGHGTMYGGLASSSVAIFDPVNVAVAGGPHSSADAQQSNAAFFLQGPTQIAGTGGDGGSHNITGGGGGGTLAEHHESPIEMIFTGDNYAGHGGNGTFFGSMTDINVAIYSPINIAIAGAGGTATATQTNFVDFTQGATQIAGIGGNGGSFNFGLGGHAFGSDTVITGDSHAGGGGSGHAVGSFVDVNVGYFNPINMAIPALGVATAQQTDHVSLDQHTTQIGGVGGEGGFGNVVEPAFSDHSLLDALMAGHA